MNTIEKVGFGFASGGASLAAELSPSVDGSRPPVPMLPEPTPSDASSLSAELTGDPIQDALLVQHDSLRQERWSARWTRIANRERGLMEAQRAHAEHTKQVNAERKSAMVNGVVGIGSAIASNFGTIGQAAGKATEAGTTLYDKNWGYQAEADEHMLKAEQAQNRSEYAYELAGDAGDVSQELQRLQSRVLEILGQIQDGEAKNATTAASQRA